MNLRVRQMCMSIRRVADDVPGRMGVSIRLVGVGSVLEHRSRESYSLASVYKVPLMATLFNKAALGEIDLDHKLILREKDKSIGSSDLIFFDAGTRLSLKDLCFLMIVHSDNTATDMIHRFLGLDAPNDYMHSLGLASIDIYCPGREGFLLLMDKYSGFRGKGLADIAKHWIAISREERIRILDEVRKETEELDSRRMLTEARRLWGISEEKETKEDRMAGQAVDNYGSPSDIAKLLELIARRKIAPAYLTRQMIEYMTLCDSRSRLPGRIPDGVMIANKTGGMPGTVNDSAIIFASKKNQVAIACFANGVKHKDCKTVEGAMAEIGLAAYRVFKQ